MNEFTAILLSKIDSITANSWLVIFECLTKILEKRKDPEILTKAASKENDLTFSLFNFLRMFDTEL